ncbi:hypothetical protein GIW81_12340 [Hyphomicrobium sp. xq]|uniref:EamA domain-containing protein n=1 Tax=Hyphomicrobium album TaxID=2665159 RepID=A0A6I3KQX9_9HYPH|nr:hypothetical protein [Hyphomicrobium album]
MLVLLGVFAVPGHMTLVRGLAVSDASFAMTLDFSRLPFSVLVGYLVFGELIDGWTWVGAIVIFAAAAFATHREAKARARPRRSRAGGPAGSDRLTSQAPHAGWGRFASVNGLA